MSRAYWDRLYSLEPHQNPPNYDGWLDKYDAIWKRADNIIDLGCGCGVNAVFLREQGIQTIACDFSETALARVRALLPGIQTLCFDLSEGLPFDDGVLDLVIADLSLHYFTRDCTLRSLRDIRRALSPTGHLLCRVNSMREFEQNEPKDENTEIEPHLYESRKGLKRFFGRDDILTFFADWKDKQCFETILYKYGAAKYVWELCCPPNLT